MFVVYLTKEERMAYDIYFKLREYAPKANLETLRQISVYLARNNKVENINNDIEIKYNENKDTSYLLLNDGTIIEFHDEDDIFNFSIIKDDGKQHMKTLIYLRDENDMSSLNIYSELKISGYGMYVVTFRPNDLSNENSLKYGSINYYTEDEIDWVMEIAMDEIDANFDIVAKRNHIFPFSEKIHFDILKQEDINLDGYQGYISNMLSKIDLLYDNMVYLKIKKKKLGK